MVHPQLKFSCVLPLKFTCTYAVHILIYSTVTVPPNEQAMVFETSVISVELTNCVCYVILQ